jgi:hypothetical protein
MSMQGAGVANSYRREDSYLECGSRAPAFSRRSRASPALMLEAWLRVPKAQAWLAHPKVAPIDKHRGQAR